MPIEVQLLLPPWTHAIGYGAALAAQGCVPNPLLIVSIDPGAADTAVAWEVKRLRTEHPGLPIVFWSREADTGEILRLDRLAFAHGVRAVASEFIDHSRVLRRQLADVANLGHDVACWCFDTDVVDDRRLKPLIRDLVDATAHASRVQSVGRYLGLDERTVRDVFRSARFGPGALVSMAVRLRVALALQVHSAGSVSDFERARGLVSGSLRKQLYPPFRRPPSHLQQKCGIAPLSQFWRGGF